jgi:hypothetical protein
MPNSEVKTSAYELLEDALVFFQNNPDKFTKGCFARSRGRFTKPRPPAMPDAREWSLPGFLMLHSANRDYGYDEAMSILEQTAKEDFYIQDGELSQLQTVFWVNDMGIEAVIYLLQKALANGNSSD